MRVVQLLVNASATENVSRALRELRAITGPHSLFTAASWQELTSIVEEHPEAIAVIDPYFSGCFEIGRLESVANLTTSRVIVYASFDERPVGRHVSQLLAAGVGEVLTQGVDDSPKQLASALQSCMGHRHIDPVLEQLRHGLSWRTFIFVRAAIRVGSRRMSLNEAAALVGAHPRTVRRWCRADGTGPRDLLRWAHLLNAARVISATDVEPRSIARRLGFSRYSALSTLYRELTGRALGDERPVTVFRVVADAFLDNIIARDQSDVS